MREKEEMRGCQRMRLASDDHASKRASWILAVSIQPSPTRVSSIQTSLVLHILGTAFDVVVHRVRGRRQLGLAPLLCDDRGDSGSRCEASSFTCWAGLAYKP